MRVLLDTHTFLWFAADDPRLGSDARILIEDPDSERLISVASLWEIAIKVSLGKLSLAEPFGQFIPNQITVNLMAVLPIETAHVSTVAKLPHHHRDPFDRMLIAQARVEQIPLLSNDPEFDAYGVDRRW